MEMYSDQVFCFTPKGDVIQLPRGATPLDYAYAIHTRIGNSCVSAKVDGIRVPLWTRLKNGQSVEIITAEGQRPQASWIDIVTTGRAKAAIRKSLREEDKGRFVKLGQELARAAFDHVGKKSTDKALRTAAKMMGLADETDLLARLGSAEVTARRVVETLPPNAGRAELVAAQRQLAALSQSDPAVAALLREVQARLGSAGGVAGALTMQQPASQ
jgi:GTP pyrophosphokinase/guanosine-3',5'-bis(diphosphate) 3'-pyrophosphohydrolase